MTNIATFSSPSPQELVSLSVEPGAPDVLSLLTTNIPLVHARLTDLRQREDHPQNHPRQVWVDLSACQNFTEVRGDVLVRALRLTQFLPSGFIGTGKDVEEMARSAHLPHVPSREFLPRVTTPRSATVPRIEIEQAEDIAGDLRRRLTAAQEESASNYKRAEVLSQALTAVREQRSRLENEVCDLNTRMSSMSGQLEWASVQHQSAETEVVSVMDRLNRVMADSAEASARAEALEGGMTLVEQALLDSRREVWELQNRLAEMEQGGVATAEDVDTLTRSLREVEMSNAQMTLALATREEEFAAQRIEFTMSNDALRAQVGELHAALVATQAEVALERSNTLALVESRDAVEKQSALTSQMLEDALTRVEELSIEVSASGQSLEQYRAQWQSLTEDHQRARDQLVSAQEEARQANQDVVDLSGKCQEQASRIEALCADISVSATELAAAKVRAEGLTSALEAAQERASQGQEALDNAFAVADELRTEIALLASAAQAREVEVQSLISAREDALSKSVDLSNAREALNADVARLTAELANANAETIAAQDSLLEAAREVAQLQAVVDETRRANETINELASRQTAELRDVRGEIDGLTDRLSAANSDLAAAASRVASDGVELSRVNAELDATRNALDAQAVKNQEEVAEFNRRLSISKAEGESLSRRLSAAQQDAQLSIAQLESVVEDLRANLDRQEQANTLLISEASSARAEAVHLRSQVAAAVSAKVSLEAQVSVLEGQIADLSNQMRGLESTIVEQEGQIQKVVADLGAEQAQTSQLRDQVATNEDVIGRQQEQIETSRQSIAQGVMALRGEQQAHTVTRQERDAALVEVESLTQTVEVQASTIVSISGELMASRSLCSEQADSIAFAENSINEVASSARADRKARAALEIELVDAQEALSQAKQKVATAPVAVAPTRHDARVRSGQRVSALGDLIITKQVSPCAELTAKGSVHIYGAMQGRAHAGCEGDRSARIYCLDFQAEQVAIAGRVVVFETIPAELMGRPVEVWLDEATNVMQVRPLNIP